jgi:perosamine synthetase
MGMNSLGATKVDLTNFNRLEPIPAEGIARAAAIMQSGEIFRYCSGEYEECETVLLERELASFVGSKYALAVNSCSSAIQLALAISGVGAGSKVLVPGFTFTAVPSAVVLLGAEPVFVECTKDYRVDLEDLRKKLTQDAKVFLLSHMRGHISDMDVIATICDDHKITLIEDAAHALGAFWRNRRAGSMGKIGCYSFQSNKIINAGEGGVLVTDDEETIVKAICMSGAYEGNYKKHGIQSPLFEKFLGKLPVHNVRMTNVTAAMARPQIQVIDKKGARYRYMHRYLRRELENIEGIEFSNDNQYELRIPDSLQFRVVSFNPSQMKIFLESVRAMGIPLSGFFEGGNARSYRNWGYVDMPDLPKTAAAIANVCDMRLASDLTEHHLVYLASAIRTAIHSAAMA